MIVSMVLARLGNSTTVQVLTRIDLYVRNSVDGLQLKARYMYEYRA